MTNRGCLHVSDKLIPLQFQLPRSTSRSTGITLRDVLAVHLEGIPQLPPSHSPGLSHTSSVLSCLSQYTGARYSMQRVRC